METTPLASTAPIAIPAAQGGPQRRERGGQRIRRFVFTLNNWTQEEYDYLTKEFAPQTTWGVIGKETGETGTSHLQGAVILGTQWSFSRLKTLTGLRRSHIECMRGKPEDSLSYCTKQDENAFIWGTLPEPGKRKDIEVAVDQIKAGVSLRTLAQGEDGAGAIAVVKFYRGLTVLRSLTQPVRTVAPKVFWVSGETGTGKTRSVFKSARLLVGGNDDDIWISSGGLRWFDGYDGQSVVIFDDFRAKHVTSFAFLLRLLDRYPVSVEFKGGFVNWVPKFIFITCPYDIESCFSTRKEHIPEDIKQLERRITAKFKFVTSPQSKECRKLFCDEIKTHM
nr:replication-associated protein [Tundra vole stool-associated circular virus]